MRRDSSNFEKDNYFNGHSGSRSVQENFNLITSFIQEAVDKYIPSKISRSVASVPWNKTHAKAKKTGSSKLRSKFQELRQQIKADIKKQHDLYVNKLVGNIKVNPKVFYRYTNSQRKDNQGIPPLKRRNGSGLAESEIEQAEEFNGQFTDVFSKTSENEVPLLEKSAPPMSDIHISNEGVIKMMKGLNPSKALGPDELHPRALKNLRQNLVLYLLICSNNLLIRVKSPRNCLWLTSVHCIRRATELYQVTIVQCP